jgi:hypothetical protein
MILSVISESAGRDITFNVRVTKITTCKARTPDFYIGGSDWEVNMTTLVRLVQCHSNQDLYTKNCGWWFLLNLVKTIVRVADNSLTKFFPESIKSYGVLYPRPLYASVI